MATLKYWLWLTTRRGLSAKDAFSVLGRFGTPEAAYFADPGEYELLPLPARGKAALLEKNLEGAERILADCDRLGIRILTLQDAEYPERLFNIDEPPVVLYVKGKMFHFDEEVAVAVVGTRHPSEYGKRMAGKLGLELGRAGALVVSGIAEGLDSAALKGALQGGGNVVSVLGGGIDVIYPRENRWLYRDVGAAGALISEYPPGTEAVGWHFPMRNRILSGLCAGAVIVEGPVGSGALITLREALTQGRETFAVPGGADAPMSVGPNLLIQRGEAKLVMSAWDILVEFEGRYPGRLERKRTLDKEEEEARLAVEPDPNAQESAHRQRRSPERDTVPAPTEVRLETVDKAPDRAYITLKECRDRFTDDERDILLALRERSLRADDLVEATQIPARRVLSALTMLQVGGAVQERPGKRFEAAILIRDE
ncbi:DNA protecting protein DprA [uncultured Eubacteriales bacterium]|uniref:DNA protecting protein DprA n=1 Tax=uncultured Eubacteriales bacterium TaxID=172733 RepID=A0A212K577_9FIRM|nr:DNA protecting protein DprA [uncultured Eubacteriales bacterium]